MNDEAVPQPEIVQTGARRAPSSALRVKPSRPLPLSLRVLLGASVALSVVAGAAVLADLTALRQSSAQLDQFRVIQGTLERLQSSLVDAETGERGYLLTGRAVYLAPSINAKAIYPTLRAELESLAGRDEEMSGDLTQLKPLIVERMGSIENAIERNKNG